jgi:processive 1,2-diacylglycerol beta-glucosyltransferase
MNVLFFHASVGEGHRTAAKALIKALEKHFPDWEYEEADILELAGPFWLKFFRGGYLWIVDNAPWFWGLMFKLWNFPGRGLRGKVQRWIDLAIFRKVTEKYLADKKFDIIIATHFYPVEALIAMRKDGLDVPPFFEVVTDFTFHQYWVQDSPDGLFLAADALVPLYRNAGVECPIEVTGIPIRPDFEEPGEGRILLDELGLDTGKFTVLILSGGAGVGPVKELATAVGALDIDAQQITVCGRNNELCDWFATQGFNLPTAVQGFITYMPDMMMAVDLIVSKTGGMTTSEALSCGTPMIAMDLVDGQERWNAMTLEQFGAAVRVRRWQDVAPTVEALFHDRERLRSMTEAAKELGRPFAARDILKKAAELAAVKKN